VQSRRTRDDDSFGSYSFLFLTSSDIISEAKRKAFTNGEWFWEKMPPELVNIRRRRNQADTPWSPSRYVYGIHRISGILLEEISEKNE
jgi:hypothetical protein